MHNLNSSISTLVVSGISVLEYTDELGNVTQIDTCSMLDGCELNDLGNVNTGTKSPGQVLFWTGFDWQAGTLNPNFNLTVSGNPAVENVETGDTITFIPEGDISIGVGPTREVTIGFTENLTSLTDIGGGVVQYTDENGATNNISICTLLNSCTLDSISDVFYPGPPGTGDILEWNGTLWTAATPSAETITSIAVNAASGTIDYLDENNNTTSLDICPLVLGCNLPAITIFDQTVSQDVSLGETITFTAGGDLTASVGPTNQVTYSFTETNTSLSAIGSTLRYINEQGSNSDIDICTVLSSSCVISDLSNVLGSLPAIGDVLTWNGLNWGPAVVQASGGTTFSCGDLNGCSIDNIGDVDVSGLNIGDVISWDGASWVNQAGGAFACASLNTCSIDALSDVDTTSTAPTLNQVLRWNNTNWVPSTETPDVLTTLGLAGTTLVYVDELTGVTNIDLCAAISGCTGFSITDGGTTETVNFGDTITFAAGGDLNVSVSATDTVTFSFTQAVTSLSNIGGGSIRYTDENGADTDISICSVINSCSADALSDIDTTTTPPVIGNGLIWNGTNWVPGFASTTISTANTDCINVTGNGSVGSPVSAEPVVAGAQTITDATNGPQVFSNNLSCGVNGLFVPCVEITEPTVTNVHDTFQLSIPCGSTSEWQTIEVAQEEILLGSFVDGDFVDIVGKVGPKVYINRDNGYHELLVRDNDDIDSELSKLQGTYGYYDLNLALTAATTTINHDLGSRMVIVQVYDAVTEVMQDLNNFTIEHFDSNNLRISTTVAGNYNVAILPVFPLQGP